MKQGKKTISEELGFAVRCPECQSDQLYLNWSWSERRNPIWVCRCERCRLDQFIEPIWLTHLHECEELMRRASNDGWER